MDCTTYHLPLSIVEKNFIMQWFQLMITFVSKIAKQILVQQIVSTVIGK